MANKKTVIKVFVTKSRKFRAEIKEVRQPKYEVTIGGQEWKKGKGKKHIARIEQSCRNILHGLKNDYEKIFGV